MGCMIELGELEAPTIRRSVFSYLSCRRFSLGQVARRAHYVSAMRGE